MAACHSYPNTASSSALITSRSAISLTTFASWPASGKESHLTLTISVPGLELVKDVLVTFGPSVDPMHFDQPWHIHWKPQAGPYPEFDGELTVRADETYESALPRVDGLVSPAGRCAGSRI